MLAGSLVKLMCLILTVTRIANSNPAESPPSFWSRNYQDVAPAYYCSSDEPGIFYPQVFGGCTETCQGSIRRPSQVMPFKLYQSMSTSAPRMFCKCTAKHLERYCKRGFFGQDYQWTTTSTVSISVESCLKHCAEHKMFDRETGIREIKIAASDYSCDYMKENIVQTQEITITNLDLPLHYPNLAAGDCPNIGGATYDAKCNLCSDVTGCIPAVGVTLAWKPLGLTILTCSLAFVKDVNCTVLLGNNSDPASVICDEEHLMMDVHLTSRICEGDHPSYLKYSTSDSFVLFSPMLLPTDTSNVSTAYASGQIGAEVNYVTRQLSVTAEDSLRELCQRTCNLDHRIARLEQGMSLSRIVQIPGTDRHLKAITTKMGSCFASCEEILDWKVVDKQGELTVTGVSHSGSIRGTFDPFTREIVGNGTVDSCGDLGVHMVNVNATHVLIITSEASHVIRREQSKIWAPIGINLMIIAHLLPVPNRLYSTTRVSLSSAYAGIDHNSRLHSSSAWPDIADLIPSLFSFQNAAFLLGGVFALYLIISNRRRTETPYTGYTAASSRPFLS